MVIIKRLEFSEISSRGDVKKEILAAVEKIADEEGIDLSMKSTGAMMKSAFG